MRRIRCSARPGNLKECALQTLRASLPQRARGRRIEASRLAAIHRLAAKAAGEPARSPWRRIRALKDPVERVAYALRHLGDRPDRAELSTLVTDAYSALSVPRRYLFARHVLPIVAQRDCLTVPAYEMLAAPLAKLAELCEHDELSATMCRSRMADWNAASAWALKLRKGDESDAQLANILLTLVAVEQEQFNADEMVALDRTWASLFRGDIDGCAGGGMNASDAAPRLHNMSAPPRTLINFRPVQPSGRSKPDRHRPGGRRDQRPAVALSHRRHQPLLAGAARHGTRPRRRGRLGLTREPERRLAGAGARRGARGRGSR